MRSCLITHARCLLRLAILSLTTFVVLLLASSAAAQLGSLTLHAAMDRALSANATIAAARLRGPINLANLAVARQRLNPEGSFEHEKETSKEACGIAVPLELGGKRARRIDVAEATIRQGEGGAGRHDRAGAQRRPARLLRTDCRRAAVARSLVTLLAVPGLYSAFKRRQQVQEGR